MNMTAAKHQKGDSEQYGLNLTIANSKKEIDALTQDELYDQEVRKNLSKVKGELQKLEVAKSFKAYALDKKLRVPDFLRNIKVIGKREGLQISSTHNHSHRASIAQSSRKSKTEGKLNENELNETTKKLLRLLPSG
jgi:serine/threonine-protein kinase RIO1